MGQVSTASDYLSIDGAQAATYTSVRSGGSVSAAVANAVAQETTRREQSADGGWFSATVCVWWLPSAQLGSIQPKEGDRVVDAGGVGWRVVDALHEDLGGVMWRVTAKRER